MTQRIAADKSVKQASSNARVWFNRFLLLLVSLGVFIGALIVLDEMEMSAKEVPLVKPKFLPPVSFQPIQTGDYPLNIDALAQVTPKWQSQMKASVRGEVGYLSPQLVIGGRVKKGETLLEIESSASLVALAESQKRVFSAKLRLLETQREAQLETRQRVAIKDSTPAFSALVSYEPQLKVANAELQAAIAELAHAKVQLAYTQVSAPFDAVVLSRAINPGETVEIGQPLFELMNLQTLEIQVKLDARQWQQLTPDWRGTRVRLDSVNRDFHCWALMAREGGYLEKKTRQRLLLLTYDALPNQTATLMPGDFVRVALPGKTHTNLLRVPQSALTRDGYLWLIDKDNRLQRYPTESLFSEADFLYVPAPENLALSVETTLQTTNDSAGSATFQVVLLPMSNFVPGVEVLPQPARVGTTGGSI